MPDGPETQLPIDQEIRRKLRAERLRTGVNSRMLLANRHDVPNGLTASHVRRWAEGMTKRAPTADVEYVLGLWASLHDDAGRVDPEGNAIPRPGRRHPKAGEDWIAITGEMREGLRRAMDEAGISVRQLVEIEDAPPELTRRMINSWLHGESNTARRTLWEFVLSRCAI